MPRETPSWKGKTPQGAGSAGRRKGDPGTSPADTDAPASSPSFAAPSVPPGALLDGAAVPDELLALRKDLLGDGLLAAVPRGDTGGRPAPTLGGVALLSRLGQGGMGAVYLGFHRRLAKAVAVKILPMPLAATRPQLAQRFLREARLAAQVSSPRVVAVLDVNNESGLFYLVMELVRGVSAADRLRETAASGLPGMSERDAAAICAAACEGLAAAHAKGIIHRDVKPSNIMLPFADDGKTLLLREAKLTDMGLAGGAVDVSLTGSTDVLGTPGYMSPEQAMDPKAVGKPADVFGMGATLYALMSGESPFTGATATQMVLATLNRPHDPLRKRRPDASDGMCRIVDRCLAKKPEDRYPDAAALLRDVLGLGCIRGTA